MAEYPITTTTLPSNTCYPTTLQALVNLVSDYATVQISGSVQPYKVGSTAPGVADTDKPWFQTETSGSGYGLPKVVRLYVNGQWKEFAQFNQGDMILVSINSTVSKPWGDPGSTYNFGDTGLPSYTVPSGPVPPVDYKYKVYVGYYS